MVYVGADGPEYISEMAWCYLCSNRTFAGTAGPDGKWIAGELPSTLPWIYPLSLYPSLFLSSTI